MCKIKYLQRDTIHKKKLKGNSSADIDNNSNESFTRGVQEQKQVEERITELEGRTIEMIKSEEQNENN